MQQVVTTPLAVSRLQIRGFIRNRLRGANVAQSKLLRGEKGGRSSGAAEQRSSGGSEDRRIGDAGYAGYYFCVVVSRDPGARAGRAMV